MDERALSFEEALAELEATVAKLEAGGLTLEEMLTLFERGQKLVALCEKALDEAELRLEILRPAAGEQPVEEEGEG